MNDTGFWVFGYGSLLWRPGFDYRESRLARLRGWRRAFCMTSIHYRGTPQAPGLVLALDRDPQAECAGLAFHVGPELAEQTLDYLRARELVSSAYHEIRQRVQLDDGRAVEALCYVVDPGHAQYAGHLPLEDQARIIASAVGPAGPNCDYLFNTATHLEDLGVHDPDLARLAGLVRTLLGD